MVRYPTVLEQHLRVHAPNQRPALDLTAVLLWEASLPFMASKGIVLRNDYQDEDSPASRGPAWAEFRVDEAHFDLAAEAQRLVMLVMFPKQGDLSTYMQGYLSRGWRRLGL